VAQAEDRLARYARLAVRVGLNLQPEQTLAINAMLEHAPLARAIAREAYAAGARYVDVLYTDQHVRRAHIEHAGEFALEPGRWKPFTSVQEITAGPPGFVWDARLPMAPLPLAVRVRDGYVGVVGSSRAAVGALVPVGGQRGTPEVAASALWRFLAEAVWLPTALLPSERLSWTALDESTTRATLTDHGATAVADFHFGPRGEVVRVTGTRYRAVGGGQVLTPTEGRHGAYARLEGVMIPTEGEVAWLLPEGPHAYWRARLVRATYAYAVR
jgi:hypothetical protein